VALELPWLALGVAVLGVAAVVVGVLRAGRSRATPGSAQTVVAAERVRALQSVARVVRRRVVAAVGLVVLATCALGAAAVVAARPMAEQIIEPETRSRDVMLCLDVSGSMTDVDAEVVALFDRLARDFEGERIGLTIFNGSPVRIFPLTDDYAFVRDQLASIRASFESYDEVPEYWIGTLNGPGASLVGDGLAACALGFDSPDTERSRSIILATDNEVNGAESVSLEDAAGYARSLDVRVYVIDPADSESATSAELRAASDLTGGGYFGLHDATTVESVVAEVQSQEATLLQGQPTIVRVDAPGPWPVVVAAFALAFVVVAGRVRA
jgi:Ca-activated chloride channel family protein